MKGKKSSLRAHKQLRKPKAVAVNSTSSQQREQPVAVGQKRKRSAEREVEEDSASEDEKDDESEDELLQTKETDGEREGEYNFEFSDMKNDFYGGVQLMLTKQLYSTGAAHDFAEIIIGQDELGTVVHCEGETDVFAYATILPAKKVESVDFIQQLANYVNHHAQASANQECKTILNSIANKEPGASKYGILFHDRYVNFPLELIYALHRNLSDDLTWILDPSKRNNEISDEVLRSFESLEHVIVFRPLATSSDNNNNSSSNSSDVKVRNVTGSSSLLFDYFEDDVYFEQAEFAWQLKLDSKMFKVSNYVMMVIPTEKIVKVADALQAMTGQ